MKEVESFPNNAAVAPGTDLFIEHADEQHHAATLKLARHFERSPIPGVAVVAVELLILQALQSHPDLVEGRIVLLGSPVGGSVVAKRLHRYRWLRWMLGRSADSGLLGDGPAWQGHFPLGVISGNRPLGIGRLIGGLAGENDGTVTVAETHLENASGSTRVHVTHTGLLLSPEVAIEVCSFLKDGHFSLL